MTKEFKLSEEQEVLMQFDAMIKKKDFVKGDEGFGFQL